MPDDTSYATAYDRAAQRRTQEDARTDEYGIAKPAKSWTERLTDYAYPKEAAQATEKPWYGDLNAFKAIPAGFAGHVMDALSPVDTRGDWHVNMPILGEIGHGATEAEYEKKRAAAEEKQCDDNGGTWDESRDQCNPSEGQGPDPAAAGSEELPPAAEPAPNPNYTPSEPNSSEAQ